MKIPTVTLCTLVGLRVNKQTLDFEDPRNETGGNTLESSIRNCTYIKVADTTYETLEK